MKKNYKVPYKNIGSEIGEEEINRLIFLLNQKQTLQCGEEREAFEKEFADFIGVKYALSLTNCTEALSFATYLLNLKPGDEIIATPLTYQATVQSLLDKDVKVKFCDIEPDSLNISPSKINELINENTRAIFLVHYGGLMANMKEIMSIAKEHGIIVIEDCAHAIGSQIHGIMPGSLGDIGCFSFGSMKNITTLGQGGMITFNNDEWFSKIDRIRSIEPDAEFISCEQKFGTNEKPKYTTYLHEKNSYTHNCVSLLHNGKNSTLSEPACAIGRVQLTKLDHFIKRRNEIANQFNNAFSTMEEFRLQEIKPNYKHSYHLYTIFLEKNSGINRDELVDKIISRGVEIVLRYFPIHLLPEWRMRGHFYGECPITEDVWFNQMINLPIYPLLSNEEVNFIIEVVKNCVTELKKELLIGEL